MKRIDLGASELVQGLLGLGDEQLVCILDSCGVGHLGSRRLFAGFDPIATLSLHDLRGEAALDRFESFLAKGHPVIFTLGYGLGLAINHIHSRHHTTEPLVYAAAFDGLAVHDYQNGETRLVGNDLAADRIISSMADGNFTPGSEAVASHVTSDLCEQEYVSAVLAIKERLRAGDTYQTNLTRKITAKIPPELTPQQIFWRLRRDHPAPFASYIKRPGTTVISASPERFFRIEDRRISTSPIKGTRPRGRNDEQDTALKHALYNSEKDRAENTMIVDLLRNDLGRVCEFGSVWVERLCDIEKHPSLFHLVSTVSGTLRRSVSVSDVIRALFPCGSITGAPKISTMRIIDRIERSHRGLSMGAIGIYMPASLGMGETLDASVAIRTMTVSGLEAEFNVGGGIVIDSEPQEEYDETVTKSIALLSALGVPPVAP